MVRSAERQCGLDAVKIDAEFFGLFFLVFLVFIFVFVALPLSFASLSSLFFLSLVSVSPASLDGVVRARLCSLLF